jgi:glycosyltransferase involved in cell wall biosynthesis
MKKRILHLTYDMRIGGTEQVIKNLIQGSDKNLFDMSIFCIEVPIGPFGQMLIEDGIQITAHQRTDGFDLKLIGAIRKHIKQNNIDILHCHQYTPWVYGALAAFGLNTKVIFTEHGRFYPDSSSWKRKLVNPLLARLTNHITAIAEATKQALATYEFIPESRIQVIYNGIHPVKADIEKTKALKRKLDIADNTLVLGTIARLDPIKNHKMMFEAFKLVLEKHPNTVLILVGDGEERQNLEALAKKLETGDKIIFTGYIEKPGHYLNCMDIFLLPSLSEGTSMTLLEAMTLSKPCVVTDAGGNSEIIKHKKNGLVTENNDAVQFSNAIVKLLIDRPSCKKMSANTFERFQSLFSTGRMCRAFSSLYLTAVSTSK